MPTYHYVCEKCGQEFDLFQSITADPIQTCPKEQCPQARWGRGRVKRVLSGGAGLLFKGQGFYTTDYRSDGYKQAAKKESESAKPKTESTGGGGGSKSGEGGGGASSTPAKAA